MSFKYLLVVVLGLFTLYVLALPRTAVLRKGFVLGIIAVMVAFVIRPDWSDTIAHFFGVGRGVDLLFYLSHLIMFFIAFIYYLKFKQMELNFTKLVRQLALQSPRKPELRSHTLI